jgi:mannose-6-phosphate isomerase-like protein (cupin superfamily)
VPAAFDLQELLAEQAQSGKLWHPFLDLPSLQLGIYVVTADDRASHQPHAMDEVYYAVSGRGVLQVNGQDQPVGPGAILFVATGVEHHFHSIVEPLTLLVFFSRG